MKSFRKAIVGASTAMILASIPVSAAHAGEPGGVNFFSILANFYSYLQGTIDPFQGTIDPFQGTIDPF